MAFNNFPYTDMHELNLDWIIKKIKDCIAGLDSLSTETSAELGNMQTQIDAIRYEVEHFIDTLDVEDEVRRQFQELVEDGTIDTIINSELGGTSTVYFTGVAQSDTHSGTILSHNGHCVVHDFGYDKPLVKNYVMGNNLIVDAIIISHYHSDHIGQNGAPMFIDFLNSVQLSDSCVAYLPHHNLDWDSTTFNSNVMRSNETAVINALTSAGITIIYPVTGTRYYHAGFEFSFFNLDTAAFDYYRTHTHYNIYGEVTEYDNYNNYSMMTRARTYGKSVVLPGDIEYSASLYTTYPTLNCDIYCIEHHSNNVIMGTQYFTRLNPKYAVVQSNSDTWNQMWYNRATASYLIGAGIPIYDTFSYGSISFSLTFDNITIIPETSTVSTLAFNDVQTYGNGVLQGDDLNNTVIPGAFNCYSYSDYGISNLPTFLSNKGAGIIKNKLARAGTQDVQQTVELANAPFASFTRYRSAGNWSQYYASFKSPYVCERVPYDSAKWLVQPSSTNYGNANCILACINGIITFSAICKFDSEVASATTLFNTQLNTTGLLPATVYGTGFMIPLSGGDALPLRCGGESGTIRIWSNAIIPADTIYVMSLTTPYFG